ncbi:MAG: hypothetical protein FJY29_13100 [Betaproteobacteria bacterium]|nr:hypothetical protein [Betaproteobacteria bacterium]
MSLKKSLLSAAAAGLASGTALAQSGNTPAPQSMGHAPAKGVMCFGTNTCKGTGSCVVTKEQITAANQAFKNQFKKSQAHECGGSNACSAKAGYLEWVKKPSNADCFAAGGFIFEKKVDSKTKTETLVVKKSN